MKKLTIAYETIDTPERFVEVFPTMQHFKEWAETGTEEDIKLAINALEKAELYEHCAVLKEVLNNK